VFSSLDGWNTATHFTDGLACTVRLWPLTRSFKFKQEPEPDFPVQGVVISVAHYSEVTSVQWVTEMWILMGRK